MLVEISLAWRFGTSPTVDAFRVGALLLIFGQQLFVFQILPHTVVPVFAEYRSLGQEKQAWHVALSLANLLAVPALLISVLAFLWPERVVAVLAPGLAGEARATACLFIRWFLLTYAPMVWSGVAAGVLYAHKVFWLPPAAQVVSNALLVVSVLTLGRTLGAICLVLGVLFSAVFGLVFYAGKLLPLMRQAGARFPWKFDTVHPGVRKSLRLALPLLGMVLLMHWTSVVLTRALSQLPSGTLAEFGYSWKMGSLVLLAPLSLATVLFPRFAETRFLPRDEEFREICTRALRMALFIAIPLSCWFYALRSPVVALLLERGAFSAEASGTVSRLFGLLLLGSPAVAAFAYMEKMLYALGNTRIPMYAQLGTAVLLTALAPITAMRFGVEGLMALSAPLLGWMLAIGIFLVLYRRHQAFVLREIAPFAVHVLMLAVASAWIARQASLMLERVSAPPLLSLALVTLGGLAAGAAVFVAACLAWQVPEAVACSQYLRWGGDAILRRVHSVVGR